MAGAKFYYNLSDSLGEFAAKTASDSSQYATPKDTFTIHNYYVDADTNANTKANYEYIAPTTNNNYGNNYNCSSFLLFCKNTAHILNTCFIKCINRLI